jgi:hypothetical protein
MRVVVEAALLTELLGQDQPEVETVVLELALQL